MYSTHLLTMLLISLTQDFANEHKGLIAVQYLIPANLNNLTESDTGDISTYYSKFLSSLECINLQTEIIRWRKMYGSVEIKCRPSSATATLCEFTPQRFPALNKISIIFLTTPVGSVAFERSFSALRRLKLWTCSSMSKERLSGLEMQLMHRNTLNP